MLRLKRPLRPSSNADPEDVLATKLRLADLGFYEPGTGEFHGYPDAEMFRGVTRFQDAAGETPDGEMLPGGPTEAALNRAAVSNPPTGRETPNAYQRAVAMGLVREEDAVSDSAPRNWRDTVERQTGMKPTPVIAPAAVLPALAAGAVSLLEAAEAAFAAGAAGLGTYNLPRWLGRAPAEEQNLEATTAPYSEAPPPEKPAPSGDFDPVEAQKIQQEKMRPPEAPPTIRMEPEQLLPPEFDPKDWVEVFPDQSGEFPQVTIVEDSQETKDFNRLYADAILEAGRRRGHSGKHTHGAYDDAGNRLKELYLAGPYKGTTLESSNLDVAVEIMINGEKHIIMGNTQTFRKSGWPEGRERKQEIKVLRNKDGDSIFVAGEKVPKGYTVDFESLVQAFDNIIRALEEGDRLRRGGINRIRPEFLKRGANSIGRE